MNTNESSWKPSEGQLECLEYAINNAKKDYSPLAGNRIYLTLKALKKQLEKIKNENIVMEDYKEKYNKLVEAVKALQEANPSNKGIQNWINAKVPELAESEDEKIRKDIRQCIKLCSFVPSNGTTKDEMFAWLEKQGRHKPVDKIQLGKKYKCIASPRYSTFMLGKIYEPKDKFLCSLMNFCSDCFEPIEDSEQNDFTSNANKVEPKFKVGDWIACEKLNTALIVNIDDDKYEVEFVNGNKGFPHIDYIDRNFHLWTIQDAKDGDVLAGKIDGDDYILIFKQIKDGWVETYGHYYDAVDRFCVPTQLFCRDYKGTFHPATKEECEQLFKKMEEEGYEWDAEKKELKKIGQNPTWSEEDEKMLNKIIDDFADGRTSNMIQESWLKSLKQRLK